MNLHGFLNLAKPSGVTSRDVVDQILRLFPRGARPPAGHAGTLDPLADGVLVLGIGDATRLLEYLVAGAKTYRAVARLGAVSDTYDADGTIQTRDVPPDRVPTRAAIEAAIAPLLGDILQKPPAHSAIKVRGKRAYDLARAGAPPDLPPRTVSVHAVEILESQWPRLVLRVHCGPGTYIRSLVHDLGHALGVGALLDALTRERVGPLSLETALDPASLTLQSLPEALLPLELAARALPRLRLDQQALRDVRHGKPVPCDLRSLEPPPEPDPRHGPVPVPVPPPPDAPLALLAPDGSLAAIARFDPSQTLARPRKVFQPRENPSPFPPEPRTNTPDAVSDSRDAD